MAYSVRFTGGYGEGSNPAAVDETLATIFRQNAGDITRLIRTRATVKHGVDRGTAERFKAAIEGAGAGCAIDDEDQLLSIDVPAPPAPPAPPAQAAPTPDDPMVATEAEVTIFDVGPALGSFAGRMVVGTLLLPFFGVGLLVLLGVWLSWKSSRYRLTNQRLFVRKGWLSRMVQEVELYRVKDVALYQDMVDRLFDVGTITVIAEDSTTPRISMPGIKAPESVKESIRNAYRTSRKREGVRAAERIID